MRQRQRQRPTHQRERAPQPLDADAGDILSAMAANGASFRFSDSGQLYVGGLSKLPPALFDLFMNHDTARLCVAARAMLAGNLDPNGNL